MVERCAWARTPEDIAYHDNEWGVPVRDDRRFFEFFILEGAQAGLSWITVLRKREAYRQAYADWDPLQVAAFSETDVARLLSNDGLIRNKLKIEGSIVNAREFLKVQEERGTFADYLWSFVDGSPRQNAWTEHGQVPASSPESDALSKDLRKRGFKFVGTTICYAFMQATGLVNDHLVSCFRYETIRNG